ncbi:SpoIIE family protein phosphatase [Streptomyces sp. SID8379]|uniref:PP2C family protein-serine/threonine phosphatase n=1 Tax=unclassified Streptomyces TaxID=2593676 RepID=UPI000362B322|nr:PP2C family protein-serine/threonine phosphatase [Streptomyces sp. HmicA12]MYW65601.1 SpoIIE family protein phosphatase [Streptomyces sp. SID8379]
MSPPYATGILFAVLCACLGRAAHLDIRVPAAAALAFASVLACAWLGPRAALATAASSTAFLLAAWTLLSLTGAPARVVAYVALLAGGCLAIRIALRDTARAMALARAVEVARVAQGALLRPVAARIGDIDVHTRHHCPVEAETVGGDVYDVVNTPYGPRLFIGDVRGHGLDVVRTSAAVLGGFRDLAYVTRDLTEVAARLDERVAAEVGPEDFVTALFAEFAPGEVRLVNCGHPPPLRLGSGPPQLLEPVDQDSPLGLGARPGLRRCWLQPGHRLLFYTDGLTEARDAEGEDFPLLERAEVLLDEVLPGDALGALYEAVTEHTGGPLNDDVALVLCQQGAPAVRPAPHDLDSAREGDRLRARRITGK